MMPMGAPATGVTATEKPSTAAGHASVGPATVAATAQPISLPGQPAAPVGRRAVSASAQGASKPVRLAQSGPTQVTAPASIITLSAVAAVPAAPAAGGAATYSRSAPAPTPTPAIRPMTLAPGDVPSQAKTSSGKGSTVAAFGSGSGSGSGGSGSDSMHQATIHLSGGSDGVEKPDGKGGVFEYKMIGGKEGYGITATGGAGNVDWSVDSGAIKGLGDGPGSGAVLTPYNGDHLTAADIEQFYWDETNGPHTVTAKATFADGMTVTATEKVVIQEPKMTSFTRDYTAARLQWPGGTATTINFNQGTYNAQGQLVIGGNIFKGQVSTKDIDPGVSGGNVFFKQLVLPSGLDALSNGIIETEGPKTPGKYELDLREILNSSHQTGKCFQA